MLAHLNSFEVLKAQLTAETLKDIEGLDPAAFGFGREECCGEVPTKLTNSMNMDKEHIFLCTSMPHTEWGKHTENVRGYKALNDNLKESCPKASLTVAYSKGDEVILRFRANASTGDMEVTQYSGDFTNGAIPWTSKGILAANRSDEYFIFICSHRSRDERCGFCGSILVELFRQAITKQLSPEAAERVTVLPCSHVGGHIYAGNVILYSKHGGVAFGLFKPTDIEAVVASIAEGEGKVPDSLQTRIRGQMVPVSKQSSCSMV